MLTYHISHEKFFSTALSVPGRPGVKTTKLRPTFEYTKGGNPHCCHSPNVCKQQRPYTTSILRCKG